MTTQVQSKNIWVVENTHSEVTFKVRHLMISNVSGSFKSFSGQVESAAADFSDADITFNIDVNSIETGQEARDNHLKSDDFFNAESFPQITFKSHSLKKVSDNHYELKGNLTIRDITKEIALKAEFGGTALDFYGNTLIGWQIDGTIHRSEFGLKWNGVTEAGSIVVSDDVKFNCHIQFKKQS